MNQFSVHSRQKEIQNGQGLVEFALALPIFLLLVFGIIEMGRLVFFYASVYTASREGARYASAAGNPIPGITYYHYCTGIRNRAKQVGFGASLTDADISISYDHGPDSNGVSTSLGSCGTYLADLQLGDRVIVTVTKNFQFIVPVLNRSFIPISSTTSRTVITGLDILSTPPYTNTPLATYTIIVSPLPTSTATNTPTPVASNTPSFTPLPSLTPTVTYTPTVTLTPTITLMPTITKTPTITLTPSLTVSPTATPSITPSLTVLPSPSVSSTPSVTVSPSASPTPTATQVPNCSQIVLSSPSLSLSSSDRSYSILIQNGLTSPILLKGFTLTWTNGGGIIGASVNGTSVWQPYDTYNGVSSPASVTLTNISSVPASSSNYPLKFSLSPTFPSTGTITSLSVTFIVSGGACVVTYSSGQSSSSTWMAVAPNTCSISHSDPAYWNTNQMDLQFQNTTVVRAFDSIEIVWSGGSQLNEITLSVGSRVLLNGVTLNSPQVISVATVNNAFAAYESEDMRFYFSSAIANLVTYVRVSFTDGCSFTYGSK